MEPRNNRRKRRLNIMMSARPNPRLKAGGYTRPNKPGLDEAPFHGANGKRRYASCASFYVSAKAQRPNKSTKDTNMHEERHNKFLSSCFFVSFVDNPSPFPFGFRVSDFGFASPSRASFFKKVEFKCRYSCRFVQIRGRSVALVLSDFGFALPSCASFFRISYLPFLRVLRVFVVKQLPYLLYLRRP